MMYEKFKCYKCQFLFYNVNATGDNIIIQIYLNITFRMFSFEEFKETI